ncbi:hypothetical protein BDQ17DRAFT_1433306 [Cyathus striatus]|nr:hypothetical protein BDQ17DRAFT_1433306 [Cyathus striatus]
MLAILTEKSSDDSMFGPTLYQISRQIQVLSPIILIYRVMQGKLCNSQTIAQITQLRFDDGRPNSEA